MPTGKATTVDMAKMLIAGSNFTEADLAPKPPCHFYRGGVIVVELENREQSPLLRSID
jgi:hypothetical protein